MPLKAFVLKPLLAVAPSQLAASFDQMAKSLQGAPFSGNARFTMVADPQPQSFTVSVHEGSARVEAETEKVDFEIITAPETWLAIAAGKLAPLDAFLQGKMRVRGDYKLGLRIFNRLAASDGRMGFVEGEAMADNHLLREEPSFGDFPGPGPLPQPGPLTSNVSGMVTCIRVDSSFSTPFFAVQPPSPANKVIFVLWNLLQSQQPAPTEAQLALLSLLREAMLANKTVDVYQGSTSASIDDLQVNA